MKVNSRTYGKAVAKLAALNGAAFELSVVASQLELVGKARAARAVRRELSFVQKRLDSADKVVVKYNSRIEGREKTNKGDEHAKGSNHSNRG